MSCFINIICNGELIGKYVSDRNAIYLKDGTIEIGTHIGWPFRAMTLEDEGKLEKTEFQVLAFNTETEKFEYTNDNTAHPFLPLKDVDDKFEIIPHGCM